MLSDSNSLWLIQGYPTSQITADIPDWGKRWARFFSGQIGITQAWVAQVDENQFIHWIANSLSGPLPRQFSDESLKSVARYGKVSIFQDHTMMLGGGLFPLIHNERVVGLIGLLCNQMDYFKPDTLQWITALTNTIAHDLFLEEIKKKESQAENSIFQIMQSNLDVYRGVPIALEILAETLRADGVVALSYQQLTQEFRLLFTQGVSAEILKKLPVRFSSNLADELCSKGNHPILIEDLQTPPPGLHPINKLGSLGFRGYMLLPLVTHGRLNGALEFVWQTPHPKEAYQSGFLDRVSEQFAFAMERDSILRNLQNENQTLSSKYNAMIEALSRTLELRDLETEGHTQRVSLLTMSLVQHMQIPQEYWDDIRRGALLHDIGKIGIPDAILLKPGSLTDQERRMMQLHVAYAYNILSPIVTSRLTLDIVHHHHEHWNGKGYPDGLKEQNIPLVARIFSVVDVFDALTSDRPYRPAWSRAQALNYLRDQTGIQFDPKVVKAFLEIANSKL